MNFIKYYCNSNHTHITHIINHLISRNEKRGKTGKSGINCVSMISELLSLSTSGALQTVFNVVSAMLNWREIIIVGLQNTKVLNHPLFLYLSVIYSTYLYGPVKS